MGEKEWDFVCRYEICPAGIKLFAVHFNLFECYRLAAAETSRCTTNVNFVWDNDGNAFSASEAAELVKFIRWHTYVVRHRFIRRNDLNRLN